MRRRPTGSLFWLDVRRVLLGVVLASLVGTSSVAAQRGPRAVRMIAVGSRVRVEVVEGAPNVLTPSPLAAAAQRLQGTVRAIAPETLYVDLSNATGTLAIPRLAIRRVEMSLGRPSRRVSALEVGAVGALLSALFVPSFIVQPGRRFGSSDRAAAAGAGIGLAVGTLVGTFRPYERWRTAWIPE